VAEAAALGHGARPATASRSLVFLNTGSGRGKSTAALGTVVRALAQDWRVCFVQFFRPKGTRAGDELMCKRLGVEWVDGGSTTTEDPHAADFSEENAVAAWQRARRAMAGGHYRLVVLDEISYPLSNEWLKVEEVTQAIASRAPQVSIVMTCRKAPDELVEVADVITEMTQRYGRQGRGLPRCIADN
jgi:cob(I)alamin adenosyltransferase